MLNTNPVDLKSFDNNIYNVQQVIPFSQGNQQFSIKLMLGISLSLALIFVILNIVKYCKTQSSKSQDQKTTVRVTKAVSLLYKHFLFPITIASFIPFMLIVSSHEISTSIFNFFLVFQAMLTSFIVFYELKTLILENSKVEESFRLQ
jgi:hypothetical protein